jgi:hypothetical protein
MLKQKRNEEKKGCKSMLKKQKGNVLFTGCKSMLKKQKKKLRKYSLTLC